MPQVQSYPLSEDFLTIKLNRPRRVAWSSWAQRGALATGLALVLCAAAERPTPLCAQRPEPPAGAIEVVLDASASMRGHLGKTEKMAVAKDFLRQLRGGLAEGGSEPPMGLRVYGAGSHRLLHDCQDTELLIRASDPSDMWAETLAAVQPLGVSLLAAALFRAASDTATTYVLITNGTAECGGDPCGVWRDVVTRGVGNRRARLHVVALAPEAAEVEPLRCLSRAGSGSFTVLTGPAGVPDAAERLALVLENRGLVEVRLTMGGAQSVVAPVRVLRPLTQEVVAMFSSRRIQEIPAGMYTVVAETAPPVSFERVLILPGETRVLENSEFGRLRVEVREGDTILRAPFSVRRSGHRNEVRYAMTGEPLILRAGMYDVSVELGDSLAIRENVPVEAGTMSRLVLGGTGTLRVVAAGFEDPPPTLAIAYGNGRADSLIMGKAATMESGRYRLVVHTLPVYVTEDVVVEADREATIVVPEVAILGVDLFGLDGLEKEPRIDVREPLTGEVYGTLRSGERRLVMPGTYRLELGTVPPRSIEGVVVGSLEREIVVRRGLSRITLAEPAPSQGGQLRLEVLSTTGRSLAAETGLRPAVTVWPGTYRARLWRGAELLWQGDISVASDKLARIDWPGP
jgi:hypothetical protein